MAASLNGAMSMAEGVARLQIIAAHVAHGIAIEIKVAIGVIKEGAHGTLIIVGIAFLTMPTPGRPGSGWRSVPPPACHHSHRHHPPDDIVDDHAVVPFVGVGGHRQC